MKNFICKKCGNTTYIMREKLNGTGKAIGLYCAKCGTWHEWLNKQEKVLYSTQSAEIDYVADSKPEQTIIDLLTEFDEMGFAPTTVCPNAEQYAIAWRERMRKEFTRLTAENDNLTVELEVAQRDVENLTRTLEKATDEIEALEAENAELKAKLNKAVELPSVKRDCELTQIVYRNNDGNIEEETYFHDCYYGQCHDVRGDVYAEARLEELKGGKE